MENQDKECLGYAKIRERISNPSDKTLILLETRPDLAGNDPSKKAKYVSETMLAFLTKLAKSEGAEEFKVSAMRKEAQNFYEKCNFINLRTLTKDALLPKERFDLLIEQNEKHTHQHLTYFA